MHSLSYSKFNIASGQPLIRRPTNYLDEPPGLPFPTTHGEFTECKAGELCLPL
jgi:hypothetical protein